MNYLLVCHCLGSLNDFVIDLAYDLVYYSDPFRLIKNTRICSFSVSPKDETTISVILTDGKVLFWNIEQHLSSIDALAIESNHANRIPLVGVMFAPPPSPHVICMCSPMTAKNWKEWRPLLAMGKNNDLAHHRRRTRDLCRLSQW
jgi:hypothetical protein